MTIKVGDLCTPTGDVIRFRYLKITTYPEMCSTWACDVTLPYVKRGDMFLCIGLIHARREGGQSQPINVAAALHVQLKVITFLPVEEIEVL